MYASLTFRDSQLKRNIFNLFATFPLTGASNSGITMTYADLGNVPVSWRCTIRLRMVGMHQGRPKSHPMIQLMDCFSFFSEGNEGMVIQEVDP
jgi:hypothetical protein